MKTPRHRSFTRCETPKPGSSKLGCGTDRRVPHRQVLCFGVVFWCILLIAPLTHANTRPVAVADSASTSQGFGVEIEVTANDWDPDGDEVCLISSPVVVAPDHGTAQRLSNTTIRFTPNPGFLGVDTFQYEIGDHNQGRRRAWVTIDVLNNSPPVAEDDFAMTQYDNSVEIDVLGNDWDRDGDLLSLIAGNPIVVAPGHGTAHRVSPINKSPILYLPNPSFVGTDSFQYEMTAGGHVSRATVTVQVSSNQPPVAVDDSATVAQASPSDLSVLNNDYDPDNDSISVSENGIVVAPRHGSAEVVDSRRVRYTPNDGFLGQDSFHYRIEDSSDGHDSALVTVTVVPAGSPPVATPDSERLVVNHVLEIPVLANDFDPDGGAVHLAEQAVVTAPNHGTAFALSQSIIYEPDPGFIGQDTFVYEVTDDELATSQGWVTVEVMENRAPVAVDDFVTTSGSIEIAVTSNDWDPDDNDWVILAAGDPVTAPPRHGTVARVAPQELDTLVYTPNPGFVGADTFQYEVMDINGALARAWVMVEVVGGVTANDDVAATPYQTLVDINVVANDSSASGQPVVLASSAIAKEPAFGSLEQLSPTTLRYRPGPGFSGHDEFVYVAEEAGFFDTAEVRITVLQPPSIRVKWGTVQDLLPLDVLEVGSTVVGDPLTRSLVVINDGPGPLRLGEISVPPGYHVGRPIADTIQAGEQDHFGLVLTASYSGSFEGPVEISHNASNQSSPFAFIARGSVVGEDPDRPIISSIDSNKIRLGNAVTLRLTGHGFTGMDVSVPPDPSGSRVPPSILSHSSNNDGTELTIVVEATSSLSEGFWPLVIRHPSIQDSLTVTDVRVVPEGPVIDAFTPGQPVSGGRAPLFLTGSNLLGATVSTDHPGAVITNLRNSNDEGLFAVLTTTPDVDQFHVFVRGAGGLVETLEMDVRRDAQGAPDHQVLSADPLVYVQKMTSRRPSDLFAAPGDSSGTGEPPKEDEVPPPGQKSIIFNGCGVTFTRTLYQRSFGLSFDLLDELGVPNSGILSNLVPGQVQRFTVKNLVAAASSLIQMRYNFCSSDFSITVTAATGVEIPGEIGLVSWFTFSWPGGVNSGVQASTRNGTLFRYEIGSGDGPGGGSDGCYEIDQLTGPQDGGNQVAEITVSDCCPPTPLSVSLAGAAFQGTVLQLAYNTGHLEIEEVSCESDELPDVAVILLSGFAGELFDQNTGDTNGMECLEQRLNTFISDPDPHDSREFYLRTYRYFQFLSAIRYLNDNPDDDARIVVVGHSLGGGAALAVAAAFADRVDRIFIIDGVTAFDPLNGDTGSFIVPSGFQGIAFNFFQISRGTLEPQGEFDVFGARNINVEEFFGRPAPGCCPTLDPEEPATEYTHANIDDECNIQSAIMQDVIELWENGFIAVD